MSSNEDDFQSRSTGVGIPFRNECKELLSKLGFEHVSTRYPLDDYGVEIELIYNNVHDISLFFDAAGTVEESPKSSRPGFERTDTVKKTIATAYLISRCTGNPVIALTSHVPDPNSSSGKMLDRAGRRVILDVICIYDDLDIQRLQRYLYMDSNELDELVNDDERSFFELRHSILTRFEKRNKKS